jgi:LPXTG-site transpeptidase (sortase) family protein
MTQSAAERELLLVPVDVPESWGEPGPWPAPPVDPGADDRPLETGSEPSAVPTSIEPSVGRSTSGIPTSSTAFVVRTSLIVLAVLAIGLVLQLTWISGLEQRSAQISLFNQFRSELALGTAPTGPVDPNNKLLVPGTPIALLTIPSIGVRQVVVEGTSGSDLTKGPGHLRNTVFPGGTGTSVIYGRAHSYSGPFGHIGSLQPGARITVITGVGTSVFKVVEVREAGGKVRPVAAGRSRLTLGTASGPGFAPSGLLLVDADKVGKPLAADNPALSTVPASELPLGTDTSTLWALFFWLEALVILLAGAVWTWRRRGRAQAWIVFSAPMVVVWLFAANQVARLLPNLL